MNYTVAGEQFRTKGALVERAKSILKNSPVGQLSGADLALMRELVEWHPEADAKIGCGIRAIEIRRNEHPAPHKGFWIVRADNTCTDFSYRKAFDGDGAYRKKFLSACRFAIKSHVERFRDEFFQQATKPTCPILGIPITPKSCHVDHAPPYTFQTIVDAFVQLNDLDINDPALCVNGEDGLLVPLFADEVLRDRFVQLHNLFAHLRVISVEANLTVIKKEPRRG